MNPRIQELAEQAARYSATMFLPTGENGNALFVEKLAELVMKDTMRVVAKQLPGNVYLDVAEAVIKHYEGDA